MENVLNVTLLEPRLKHPTIFAEFDKLNEGESLVILNDHDPKPLYYQLLGMRGEIFTWEYQEQGPEWWRINISKIITGEGGETLGEIAAKDLRKAQIFKKHGLDFCCGGNKTVKEACEEKGLNVIAIEQELQQADQLPESRPLPYNEWGIDFLSDYIVNTHHSYLRKNLPDIQSYSKKVLRVHGLNHPELARVNELVEAISSELTSHMVKEEQVLFPFIKHLVAAKNGTLKYEAGSFGSVENPVNDMIHEHKSVGNNLEELHNITGAYKLPSDACASYSLLYRMLHEMEDDIHLHIHLENNILFPKAVELEKSLR
ncbi:MAG TPA: iron-sulfur cluster repair di-iron protein [Candidatus Kapabacteria bacterium]|nr:iron-sulfur cluster repair di-iron protein [Candidatus Kapabacteria bacterium]